MGHGVSKAASDAGHWIKGAWGTAKKFAVSAEPYVRGAVNTASKFAPQLAEEFPEASAAILGAQTLLNSGDKYSTAAHLGGQIKPQYAETFNKMSEYAKMGRDAYNDYSANKPKRPSGITKMLRQYNASRSKPQSVRAAINGETGRNDPGPKSSNSRKGTATLFTPETKHNPINQGLWGGNYNLNHFYEWYYELGLKPPEDEKIYRAAVINPIKPLKPPNYDTV